MLLNEGSGRGKKNRFKPKTSVPHGRSGGRGFRTKTGVPYSKDGGWMEEEILALKLVYLMTKIKEEV